MASLRPTPAAVQAMQAAGGSHMLRFTTNPASLAWGFWVDLPAGAPLSVGLSVMHLEPTPALAALRARQPAWLSVAAATVYQSQWQF